MLTLASLSVSGFWPLIHTMRGNKLHFDEDAERTPCLRSNPFCVQELHHKNRYWHEDCFRCAKCYKPLASEPFNARDDGKIMCGKCGSREDGNRCQGCYKVVMPGGSSGGPRVCFNLKQPSTNEKEEITLYATEPSVNIQYLKGSTSS